MDTRKEKGTLSVEIETAYSLVDNRNYSSEEIKEVLRNLRSKDEEQFLSFLVCPFCKIAKCEYVNELKYPHFSMPETAIHKDGCYVKKEEYTQAELKSNLKRGNVAFIERAIDEFISVYCGTKTKSRVSEFKRLPLKLATLPLKRSESGNLDYVLRKRRCLCEPRRRRERQRTCLIKSSHGKSDVPNYDNGQCIPVYV